MAVTEIVIFVAFVGIQYAAKALPTWLEASGKTNKLVNQLADNHFAVWLAHPAILHGLHDYVIHFVVYSGYIIHH